MVLQFNDDDSVIPLDVEPTTLNSFPTLGRTDYIGCSDRINAIAIDLVGMRVVAASCDDTCRIWQLTEYEEELSTGVMSRSLLNKQASASTMGSSTRGKSPIGVLQHADWVNCVVMIYGSSGSGGKPASVWAATGCEDGMFTCWNLEDCAVEYQRHLSHGAITALCVREEMCVAATLFDVYLVSCAARSVLRQFRCRSTATAIAASVDCQTVYVGQQDGIVVCWDVLTGAIVRELAPSSIQNLPGSPSINEGSHRFPSPPPPPAQPTASAAHMNMHHSRSTIRTITVDPSHSRSGSNIVTTSDHGHVAVWATSTGELLYRSDLHQGKPILAACMVSQRRKRRAAGGGAGGLLPHINSNVSGQQPKRNAKGDIAATELASPTKAISPKFHDAAKTFIITLGHDGVIQVTELDTFTHMDVGGAYAFSATSYQDPASLLWYVVWGDNQGNVRSIEVTNMLAKLEERSGVR